MSYYHFNRKDVLQKAKERYFKEKAAKYYLQKKKATLQNKLVLLLLNIRTSEKTLKFDNIRVNKKEFHKFKQRINLDLVNVDKMVISGKFNHSDDSFKYFIGYKDGEIVKPLCIILPQMSGYIKYFGNVGKNLSFIIKDDDVINKNNEI